MYVNSIRFLYLILVICHKTSFFVCIKTAQVISSATYWYFYIYIHVHVHIYVRDRVHFHVHVQPPPPRGGWYSSQALYFTNDYLLYVPPHPHGIGILSITGLGAVGSEHVAGSKCLKLQILDYSHNCHLFFSHRDL